MARRWLDLDWSAVPAAPDPEAQAWTRETLARIALGGREEEVAAWRTRMAKQAACVPAMADGALRTCLRRPFPMWAGCVSWVVG